MARAKKQKNGHWRVLVYDFTDQNGKRHYKSITADTKAEAEYLAMEYKRNKASRLKKGNDDLTVSEIIDMYIDISQTLSPTTIARYEAMHKHGFQMLMNIRITDLNDITMQQAINIEAKRPHERTGKTLSPKTVKNEYGLLSAAIKGITGRTFNVKLPKVQSKPKELPPPELVASILKGTKIELPVC